MCPSEATCLPMDCCFSELAYKDPIKHVGLVQRGHYHFIEFSLFFCHNIAEKLLIWHLATITHSLL
jgi:hypothetical protein